MSGLFAGTPLERPVTCEHCGKSLDDCVCPRDAAGQVLLPRDQQVRIRRERRRGKWTTVIAGLDPNATDLQTLLKELRSTLATGGSIASNKAGARAGSSETAGAQEIELQGDHRDRVLAILRERGYAAKPAGG